MIGMLRKLMEIYVDSVGSCIYNVVYDLFVINSNNRIKCDDAGINHCGDPLFWLAFFVFVDYDSKKSFEETGW